MTNLRPVLLVLLAALGVAGLNSCQIQRMESELTQRDPDFDAKALYVKYREQHGQRARKVRQAASSSVSMRVHIEGCLMKGINEYIPLTKKEVCAARKILSETEEVPPRDYRMWLKEEYDSVFGPQPSPPMFGTPLEFVSSNGKVSYYLYLSDGLMGDAAKAEEYRTAEYRPGFMLPTASLARWNALPFHKKLKRREYQLYRRVK